MYKKIVLLSSLGVMILAGAALFTTTQAADTDYAHIIPVYDPHVDFVQAPSGFGTGAVWHVGPTRTYKNPSDVVSLVHDGDIVEVDAATYRCNTSVKWSANFLTLVGVGGRPVLDATGCGIAGGKGIWNPLYSMHDMIIDNFEFMGAQVGDENGAGIRYDGTGYLYITNSFFHDNQNGVLLTPGSGTTNIVIDHSEFARNGTDAGRTHNMYISSGLGSFVLRFSYSHDSHVGHLVKSRAQNNYILYNRLADETQGDSSYNIDIPNGGLTYIIGNIIEQGPNSSNYGIISYSSEGNPNPIQKIYVANNTIVNNGSANATALNLYDQGLTDARMVNNLIVGVRTENLVAYTPNKITLAGNIVTSTPGFNTTNNNYILGATSPAVNTATDAGSAGGFSLTPVYEFLPPAGAMLRPIQGTLDVGAQEYDPAQVVVPAPTLRLSLSNNSVGYNTPATLSWSSTNANTCRASGGWSGPVATTGTLTTGALTANTTITLTCTGPGGNVSQSVAIVVNDSTAAAALGTYAWKEIPNSMINTVCPANRAEYADNQGTGPWCESKGGNATGVYVPELGKWYLMGGFGGRNYYGNEVYDFNFATQKPELATEPTHISQTKEYAPDDTYGSKVHLASCSGVMHLLSGAVAPAPRGLTGETAYNPLTKKIVVGPGGYAAGLGGCSTTPSDQATDIWNFDPFNNTWSLVASDNERFGGVGSLAWFMDPATGLAYVAGNRNSTGRGGYLVDTTSASATATLVNNVWPFQLSYGPFALDTTHHYALQLNLDTPATMQMYNTNGLSQSAYGTLSSKGTTGVAGSAQPLYVPDTTWTLAGDTSVASMPDVGITYNPKIQKFVAWAGGDVLYFLTPNYQTKTLYIVAKHVAGNPTSAVGVAYKFTYIPERDVYLAFVGTDKNFYYLVPPTSNEILPTPATNPNTSSTLQKALGAHARTTASLNVRATPSLTKNSLVCTQSKGSTGTITKGPVVAAGHTWWHIDYTTRCDGWSADDYLLSY